MIQNQWIFPALAGLAFATCTPFVGRLARRPRTNRVVIAVLALMTLQTALLSLAFAVDPPRSSAVAAEWIAGAFVVVVAAIIQWIAYVSVNTSVAQKS